MSQTNTSERQRPRAVSSAVRRAKRRSLLDARETLQAIRSDLAPIHYCDVVSPECKICAAVVRIDEFLERTDPANQTGGDGNAA